MPWQVSCDPALNLVSNPGFEIGRLGAFWKKATGSLVIVTSANAYDGWPILCLFSK